MSDSKTYDRLNELLAVKLQVVHCARALEAAGLVASAGKLRWIAASVQAEIGVEETRVRAREREGA